MTVAYVDPFEQFQRELDRMLGSTFGSVGSAGVYPPVNVFDGGEAFVVKAELPGVDPAQVEIEVEDDTLVLRGERRFEDPKREVAYHRRERDQGRFRRVVRLPGRLAADQAKAEYRNGVLTIRLPKVAEAQPRRIEIKAA